MKLFRVIYLCVVLAIVNSAAIAETSSSQTITASLRPYVSVSNVNNTSSSVSINGDGTLSGDLVSSFKFVSNNANGASATFNIKVNTSDDGQVDAMSGITGLNTGKIVLANTSIVPDAASVKNALSNSPVSTDNPDAIAYQFSFKSGNSNTGIAVSFDKSGKSASGNVLAKNGSNTINIFIDKSSVRQGTFSNDDDVGNYQATIYCTSSTL